MINVKGTVIGDGAVIARLTGLPDKIRADLKKSVLRLTISLQRKVKQDKLAGQVLNKVTGKLGRSIQFNVKETPSGVSGAVGSGINESNPLVYARIHEYGGVIHIPEIFPVNAKVLRFTLKSGATLFRKSVKAHDVHMPERSYLRSSLKEMTPEIIADLTTTVEKASKR